MRESVKNLKFWKKKLGQSSQFFGLLVVYSIFSSELDWNISLGHTGELNAQYERGPWSLKWDYLKDRAFSKIEVALDLESFIEIIRCFLAFECLLLYLITREIQDSELRQTFQSSPQLTDFITEQVQFNEVQVVEVFYRLNEIVI